MNIPPQSPPAPCHASDQRVTTMPAMPDQVRYELALAAYDRGDWQDINTVIDELERDVNEIPEIRVSP